METLLRMSNGGADYLLTKIKRSSGNISAAHCSWFGHNIRRVTGEVCLLLELDVFVTFRYSTQKLTEVDYCDSSVVTERFSHHHLRLSPLRAIAILRHH